MGHFLHHLNPDIRKMIRRLECLHLMILKRKYSPVFHRTCLNIFIYIYMSHSSDLQVDESASLDKAVKKTSYCPSYQCGPRGGRGLIQFCTIFARNYKLKTLLNLRDFSSKLLIQSYLSYWLKSLFVHTILAIARFIRDEFMLLS